ncbi:MAG TPA: BTAD domain-containing putative transcriptional regulator, partial [Umezawaea sp.]|nr:BTAD domain-containing putative transcriptional regulator [Umezawaea sp.]
MRVNILGSLEFRRHGSPVIFEGSRQRTILALLLLNHNTVVPANRMMQALWRHGAPPTARKMLQNAVSQLRFVLHDTRSDDQDTAVLLTHSPGYFLRLPPECLDLEHFRRLAEEGSARLRDEQWDSASATLRKALQVWRGPVLADLAESVSWWPEVIALEEERLKVVQEYCEASLASGHFAEVVDELEAHASSEPFRARMAGQLMRALSLSDHHADTLVVFDRARALLARSGDRGPGLARVHRPGLPLDAGPALPPPARTPGPAGGTPPEVLAAVPDTVVPEARARTETVVAVEKDVSVLAVLTHPRHGGPSRTTAAAALRSESLRRGGEFVGEFGPYVVAVFGAGRSSEIDVPLAVGVAFTVEESLRSAGEVASVAVTTGKALIGTPSLLAGPLLDRVLDQVATCSPGTVSLCETTQWAASSAFAELQSPGWRIRTERLMSARSWSPDRLIARTREVGLMHDRWELVRRQRTPQLVTLLGDPHMGKSRIVTEFHRRMGEAGVVNALMIGLSERRRTAVPASMLLARLARMCVGADRHDDPTVVLDRLAAAVDALPISPDERRRLRAQLPALAAESTAAPSRDAAVACVRLLRHTLREPTVLIIDDLHLADDWLLDTVDDLSGAGDPVPLLIVVTARQQLLDRR